GPYSRAGKGSHAPHQEQDAGRGRDGARERAGPDRRPQRRPDLVLGAAARARRASGGALGAGPARARHQRTQTWRVVRAAGALIGDRQMRTNGGRRLPFSWKESHGPRVSAPSAHGFGRTLIEQTVRARGGEASVDYRTDGLTCEIKLPLPEAARPSTGIDASAPKTSRGPSLLAQPDNRRTLQ